YIQAYLLFYCLAFQGAGSEEYFVCASLPDYPAHLFMHPDTFNTEVDFSNCQVFVESQRGSMICMLPQY
ncbi:hypothetical protein, partial [Escherichia coli]|uniref:hypothetical protein n=4 Tax=Escherichia coli TaxID=562 RepID=UPI001BB47A4C